MPLFMAERQKLCPPASVCTENSGKIGVGPAAEVGLGSRGKEDRAIREISHCTPCYAFGG